MKKLLLSALFAVAATTGWAQRSLTVDPNITMGQYGDENLAGVIFKCEATKPLTFDSNLGEQVSETVASGDSIYYLFNFPIEQGLYRKLTITSPGYTPMEYDIRLYGGRLQQVRIYDPNDAIDRTPYQQHRLAAEEYFSDANYYNAREEYVMAKNAADNDENLAEAEQKIADCDSIRMWLRLGCDAEDMLDYQSAMAYFERVQNLNPSDRSVVLRVYECREKNESKAQRYFDMAQFYFDNKEYADAIEMYQKVESLNSQTTIAGTAIKQRVVAENRLKNQKIFARGLFVEMGKSWGFSFQRLAHRNGNYFSLRMNKDFFSLCQHNPKLEKKGEISMSLIGKSIYFKKTTAKKVFGGVWLHLGVGIVVANKFSVKDFLWESEAPSDSRKEAIWNRWHSKVGAGVTADNVTQADIDAYLAGDATTYDSYSSSGKDGKVGVKSKEVLETNIGYGLTPEVGLTVKIWHFALRGTYQYRWFVSDKDHDDMFGTSRFYFGVGYCF